MGENFFNSSQCLGLCSGKKKKKNVITLILVIFKTSFKSYLSKVTTITILSA